RRTPFRRIGLLHVIHEVQSQSFWCACIQRGKNAGLAVGRHFLDALKSRVAQQLHHQRAAFVHSAIFRGDGGLLDPVLQAFHRLFVVFFNFRADAVGVFWVQPRNTASQHSRGVHPTRCCRGRQRCCSSSLQERSASRICQSFAVAH